MDYYVQEGCLAQADDLEKKTAASKARLDVESILKKGGANAISLITQESGAIFSCFRKMHGHIARYGVWKRQLGNLKKGDRLFVEMPVTEHSVFLWILMKKLVYRGIAVVLVIHDLELLRLSQRQDIPLLKKLRFIVEEYTCLKVCSRIIAHNGRMTQYLSEKLEIKKDKIISLDIFDYLIPGFQENRFSERVLGREEPVIIAGNLEQVKAGYVYHLPGNYRFHLYGVNYRGSENDNIRYFGSFPAEELPYAMNGSFGLVWDGDKEETCSGVFGNYLKINNPHKTSLYLASGIPVIIWNQAALSDFIRENKCGITVNSLHQIKDRIAVMSEEEYEILRRNAASVGEKLRSGYYMRKAMETSV